MFQLTLPERDRAVKRQSARTLCRREPSPRDSHAPLSASNAASRKPTHSSTSSTRESSCSLRAPPDSVRRELLSAFFTRLNVQVSGRDISIGAERTEINEVLYDWHDQHQLNAASHTPTKSKRAPRELVEGSFFTTQQVYSVQRFE